MNAARMAVPPESAEGKELFNNLLGWFTEGNALVWPIGDIKVPNIFKNNIKKKLMCTIGVGERGGVECVAGGTVRGLSWVCVVARACVLSWVEI